MTIAFHIAVPVWGKSYVDRYLKYSLPSSLVGLSNPLFSASEYHCFTPAKYHEAISEALRGFPGKTVMHAADVLENVGCKYALMSAMHTQAYKHATSSGAYTLFLPPDVICSDNLFTYAYKLVEQGAQAVQLGSIRMNLDTYLPWYDSFGRNKPINKFSMQHVHPWSAACFWNAKKVSVMKPVLHWDMENYVLSRSYHVHPLVVCPNAEAELRYGTCDAYLVEDTCEPNKIAYITDSKDGHWVEFSDPHSMDAYIVEGSNSYEGVQAWASANCTTRMLENYKHPMITWK